MIRLNGYEFRFRKEADDFIPNPNFKPLFWQRKDDDVYNDKANKGKGKGPKSAARPASASGTSMDVDSSQAAVSGPDGNSVTYQAQGLSNFAVTPLNPNPRTPRGIEIVERAKRVSPSLIAAPNTDYHVKGMKPVAVLHLKLIHRYMLLSL
jgi:hypothetical protein